MKEFYAFLAKDFPEGDKLDQGTVVGYGVAQTLVQVLKQCGDNLTRENIMKQAASLKDFRTEVLLPGIKINTGPDRFCADQPAAADAVQGRALGPVRRRHQRRRRRLTPLAASTPLARKPPRHPRGFSFAAIGWITSAACLHSKSRETMTDRRPLLRAIFDAAVAAAHPDVVLARASAAPRPGAA